MCTLQGVRGKNICPYWAATSVLSCCQVPKKCPAAPCLMCQVSCLFLDWWVHVHPRPLCIKPDMEYAERRGRAFMKHFLIFLLTRLQILVPSWRGLWKPWEGERAPQSFAGLHPAHRLKNQVCRSLTLMKICLFARKEKRLSLQWTA